MQIDKIHVPKIVGWVGQQTRPQRVRLRGDLVSLRSLSGLLARALRGAPDCDGALVSLNRVGANSSPLLDL